MSPKNVERLAALDAIERAATDALDAVERLLFGKLGGAEEAAKSATHSDPIERLRAEHGLQPQAPAPAQTRQEQKQAAMDEARKQLEALKRARAKGGAEGGAEGGPGAAPAGQPAPTEPFERKRTL